MTSAADRLDPPQGAGPVLLDRLSDHPGALVPRQVVTADGARRRVGVEIEFAGLELARVAELVCQVLGGWPRRRSVYEWVARATRLGDIRVELDSSWLKELGRRRERRDATALERMSEAVLSTVTEPVAPWEIVTPPLDFADLPHLDELTDALAVAGAEGTQSSWVYAFGVHFNPRAPSEDAASLLSHVQAYMLLAPWIRAQLGIDVSRRVSPFIDPFPPAYEQLVLARGYEPDMGTLINDYLDHNPTRNRALDMLPLLMHVDRARVVARLGEGASASRPTYHFRLADSRVGERGWSVTRAWRYWLIVEDLAAEPVRLQRALRSREAAGSDLRPRDDDVAAWLA